MEFRDYSKKRPKGRSLKVLGLGLIIAVVVVTLVFSYALKPSSQASAAPNEPVQITHSAPQPVLEPLFEVRPKLVSEDALFADVRTSFDPAVWKRSTHDNNDSDTHYGGPWIPENIEQMADRLVLKIRAGSNTSKPTMAELKTHRKYGHGRYEVIMRPSGEQGTVSAFFTYTGPWQGDPHDEIDIEFVGRRPGHVEFNYFQGGIRGKGHKRIKLGFDASESMNLYAFEWHPDEIIWFINGEEVYRTPKGRRGIPTHPSKLFISAWTGTERIMREWIGEAQFGATAQSEYACLSFTPFGDTSYRCADMFAEDPQFKRNENSKY